MYVTQCNSGHNINFMTALRKINSDFNQLYDGKGLKLFMNWDQFFAKIQEVKKTGNKDKTVAKLLELRENIKNQDSKFLIELKTIALLIPSKGRFVLKNSKHWKFSTQETVEGIVVEAKTAGDIDEVIRIQKEKALAHQQTVQPYIIYVGSIEDPRAFYIVIDTIYLHFDNPIKAFDILFKIFHIMNAKYP
ncbi:uncharacterized protein LOC116170646 [Photinus pyralis]|uniref:uncharacterized protein LOC116170646 n=1 Tax=Photinus pyralis TaxID=7054 RepID=UPI0012670C70|nr:uncharacterized protein LOC116170646 [Photinus pyralis]